MAATDPRWEIARVLDTYADALDARDWALLDRVFTEDVEFDFGEWIARGRARVVETIRSYLDGCGPTQHLLGNYRIDVEGERASSRVYVRAFHVGRGAAADRSYEMAGEYRDELIRTATGWRSTRRRCRVLWENGSREVLGPAGRNGE